MIYKVRGYNDPPSKCMEFEANSAIEASKFFSSRTGDYDTHIVTYSRQLGHTKTTTMEYVKNGANVDMSKEVEETKVKRGAGISGDISNFMAQHGYHTKVHNTHPWLDGPDALDGYHAITYLSTKWNRALREDDPNVQIHAGKIARAYSTHRNKVAFLSYLRGQIDMKYGHEVKDRWADIPFKEYVRAAFVREAGEIPALLM